MIFGLGREFGFYKFSILQGFPVPSAVSRERLFLRLQDTELSVSTDVSEILSISSVIYKAKIKPIHHFDIP